MTIYEVWKINEAGKYERVTITFEPKLAGKIKNKLIAQGIFAQVCKAGEMNINGSKR